MIVKKISFRFHLKPFLLDGRKNINQVIKNAYPALTKNCVTLCFNLLGSLIRKIVSFNGNSKEQCF